MRLIIGLLSLCLVTWASEDITTEVSSETEDLTNLPEHSSEQPEETWIVETRAGSGWSSWSDWSTCSRSCDGGVSHQLRRCNSPAGCKGEPVRYKICNMQPCPESHDFRAHQCSAFNSVPYEGQLLHWIPHHDESDPCSLICRGHPGPNSLGTEEEVVVVTRLADRVHDGTRCRPGSLDMCIDGKCRRVGCDLRIGSNKKVDACGVCGGDGSSCAQPLYHWTTAPMSLCSQTCGGGYKMSRPVCQNRVTGTEVEEQLCNAVQKPEPTVVKCNTHKCPPRWQTGEWGPCSVSCGGGSRLRQVQCVEELSNGTKNKVAEHNCRGHKPRYQEACNQMDCPKWHSSPWSGCSVSCEEGHQVRHVECRDSRDQPSSLCTLHSRPETTQPCSTGIPCPPSSRSQLSEEDDHLDELLPGLYHTQPLVQPYPPQPPIAERLVGEQVVPSESTFIADDWGPCSVSCGEGIRKREVHCKIFLEFSRTIAKLPDKQCSGPKPSETERCVMEPCSMANRIDTVRDGYLDQYPDPYKSTGYDTTIRVAPGAPGKSYSWKEQGYTHCSASCLGGVQELIVNCVRDDTQRVTSPYMCSPETKPEILVRTCNDHPCPPRWNYSDFQPCTKSCGIGIQTREVNCIHEVTQGGGNTVVVPNNMCPQPPPPDRQYCNVLDCPVKWHTTEWSKCSKSCGGGMKERKVECKQVMAQNHVVDRPPSMCPSNKPHDRKPCNTKSCVMDTDKPQIMVSNSSFIQHNAKTKKVTVKIGGSATVFHGTMIKIKCHVKRFNRTRIQWAKDHNYLGKSKKFKISKKGALRIQNLTYRDSGVYTCIAGRSSADLNLTVKPKPGEFPTSEEIEKAKNEKSNVDKSRLDASDVISRDDHRPMFLGEDQSHEQKPGDPQPLPKKPTGRNRSFKPTMPPILSHGDEDITVNRLDALAPQSSTTLMSEKDQGLLPSQLPANGASSRPPYGGDGGPKRSSASRPMPHFQQLLANLQTFSNSRGHRTVSFHDHHVADEQHPASGSLHIDEEEEEEDDGLGRMVVLGKGSADSLKFEWMITEWTKCSQTCGGDGFQMRAARCMVRLHNTTQDVDSSLCEDAGLEIPATVRKCGTEECPVWVTTSWTRCSESRCFNSNTAMQRRDVKCQIANQTVVDNSLCDEREKPTHRQECYNEKCKGVWKVGPWSQCAPGCKKYRILQCVWYGTKRPAGNACRDQPRPPVSKTCKGPPCTKYAVDCRDHTQFCPNVRAMNMCRLHRYQQQCCHTCRFL